MEHTYPIQRFEIPARPWRVAAVALAGIAVVEVVLLVVAGGALLIRPDATRATTPAVAATTTSPPAAKPEPKAMKKAALGPMLPRSDIRLIVLNGSGRAGAAGAVADRATRRGYRVQSIANAPSTGAPRSIVMYRRGSADEGVRLARDLGIRTVSPLDGMRPSQLHGAHTVLLLGG